MVKCACVPRCTGTEAEYSGGSSGSDGDEAGDGVLFVDAKPRRHGTGAAGAATVRRRGKGSDAGDADRTAASSAGGMGMDMMGDKPAASSSTVVRCTLAPVGLRYDAFVVQRVLDAVDAIVNGGTAARVARGGQSAPQCRPEAPSVADMEEPPVSPLGHGHGLSGVSGEASHAGPGAGAGAGASLRPSTSPLAAGSAAGPSVGEGLPPHGPSQGDGAHGHGGTMPHATLDICVSLPLVQAWLAVPEDSPAAVPPLATPATTSPAPPPVDPRAIRRWLCAEVVGLEVRMQQATPFSMSCGVAMPSPPSLHAIPDRMVAPSAVDLPRDASVSARRALPRGSRAFAI
jgi:hypothetical protein